MKVKLKDGLTTIASAFYELRPGVVTEIPDKMFDATVMDKVSDSGKEKVSSKKETKKPKEEPKKKEVQFKKDFKDELLDLPGIGPKITEKILNMAKTKEGLAKIPREALIDELKDDVVVVLDKYLGR